MRGKFFISFFFSVFLSLVLIGLYLYLPPSFESFDARVRDFFFKVRGPEKVSSDIVIIDIDEKSIKQLGQWPWGRDKLATILYNLSEMKAGIIGLDIVFSEMDRTSPSRLLAKYHIKSDEVKDYDAIFAQALSQTPTILGYIFDFEHKDVQKKEAPYIPITIIQEGLTNRHYIPQAKSVLPNIEIFQESAYSSGFINNLPDDSGVIRSVPLLISYRSDIYPSLAFEMYRLSLGVSTLRLQYNETGLENLYLGDKVIASDRFAKLYVNFKGTRGSYKYISAVDIYNNKVDKREIEGKYVLIGTSAYGLMDLRATPFQSVIPGVEIHANVIDNLINNEMLVRASWVEAVDIFLIIFLVFGVIFGLSIFPFFYFLFLYMVLFFVVLWFLYYTLFVHHFILSILFPILALVGGLIGSLVISYLFESKQKELIKKSFSKKVSKQVMDELLRSADLSTLQTHKSEVSVYFSDIRSFTELSEKVHDPKKIVYFLNTYMDAMVQEIENTHGTIDKFIGDAIMAYWNAPIEVKNHADIAVQTALKQLEDRVELNTVLTDRFHLNVDFGIGINTGVVVVGEVGSLGRSDYTVIGDAVNLASRLEGLCKVYKVRLIVSQFTKERLQDRYVVQLLDKVRVKGKKEAVIIYEVLSQGEPTQEKAQELKSYESAYNKYIEGSFEEASLLFQKLSLQYGKYLYTLYMQRCQHLATLNPSSFDGIYEYSIK